MNEFTNKLSASLVAATLPFLLGQIIIYLLQTLHSVDLSLFVFSGCGILAGILFFEIWKD